MKTNPRHKAFRVSHQVNQRLTALTDDVGKKAESLPESDRDSFLDSVLTAIVTAWNKVLPQRPFTPQGLKRHVGGNFYQWSNEPGKAIRLLFHDLNHIFMSESFERFIPTISSDDGSRSFHTYIHEAANAFLEYGSGTPRIDSFVDMATKVIANQAGEWLKKRRGPDWDAKLSPEEFTETCLEVLEKEVRDYQITAGNDPFMAGMVGIFRKILIAWGKSDGILSVNRQTFAMANAVSPLLNKAVNALAEKHSETRVDMEAYQEYLTSLIGNVRKVIAMGPKMGAETPDHGALLEYLHDIRKGWFAIVKGGDVRELIQALNETVVRRVPPPGEVPKIRGAIRAFSFHWSNAQSKWDVITVREFPHGIDGAEFVVFVGRHGLSPLGKPWTLGQMKEVAQRLNKHPGYASSPDSARRATVTQEMVARVAAKVLDRYSPQG